ESLTRQEYWTKLPVDKKMEEEMNNNDETYCAEMNVMVASEDENVNDSVYKFYKMYGMKKGFGIRKYHTRRDKDGGILWQSFFVHELVGEHYGAMIASNRRMIETDVTQINTMIEVEVWELLGDSRLSERSSPKRGTQCCSQRESCVASGRISPEREGARSSERVELSLDKSRLSERLSPKREHQFLNDAKSHAFSPKRAYPRLSESLKSENLK
ncbi:hypothetical protein Lal_00014706, partial [Lupinus albus]